MVGAQGSCLKEERRSVLQAILTYSMICFLLPKTLCTKMEDIIAKFWLQKKITFLHLICFFNFKIHIDKI